MAEYIDRDKALADLKESAEHQLKQVPHQNIPYDVQQHWLQQFMDDLKREHELNKRVIICSPETEDIYKRYFPEANVIVAPKAPEGIQAVVVTDEKAKRDINMYRMMIKGEWNNE